MTEKFILWAQALDNASPDHLEMRGKVLEPDDTVQRQEAVSLVSSVIKGGKRVCEKSGVLLTADDSHFIVEVPSAQRDSAGRTAPIVCYGNYDATVIDVLGASAAVALDDFARRIGRTLQPDHFELARASFETLKKKSSTAKLVRTAGIGTVGLVLLVIVYWLAKKAW
ncbi:hypothetical protein [Cupriavidus pauculus]|uniref:hypothetical protein n=1 Tax=Cupriavidus pauculus TaxID=82633 RepID=UPI0007842506|nr:hypothetical protein [Cupriavidus pauculus]